MKVGSNEVKDILIGDTQVLKVYRGEEVVWERGGLPSGYTEVKYLRSSGTQYINTGISVIQNLNYKIKFKFYSGSIGNGWNNLFGVYSTSGGNVSFTIIFHSYYGYMQVYSSKNSYIAKTNNYRETDITIVKDGMNVYLNDELFGTLSNAQVTGRYIYLFTSNAGDYPKTDAVAKNLIIYSLELYDNTTLIQKLIPCLDNNNVPCFFDMVSRQTFYNAGTGTFGYETMDGTVVSPT